MILLPEQEEPVFPELNYSDPDGLLAFGGLLNSKWLIHAYGSGIFPWFNSGDPILWWSPDPRMVLFPNELRISKSMRPYLNQPKFEWSINKNFKMVVESCAQADRKGQEGTWIDARMLDAYLTLHQEGWAHSVEVYQNEKLVGGLYGLIIGKVFFGESMFSLVNNASKFGFIRFIELLRSQSIELIDCQVYTKHLESLGARMITRKDYATRLDELAIEKVHKFS